MFPITFKLNRELRLALSSIVLLVVCQLSIAQTKVGGIVLDEYGDPVAFANVFFPESSDGTITNDNGRFYLQSDKTYDAVKFSFVGYKSQTVTLDKKVNLNMQVTLSSDTESLSEVVIYSGKTGE